MPKIYTKTGDTGQTGLLGGSRVSKDSARIEAIGSVDEANASIGKAISYCKDAELGGLLKSLQRDLFDSGAILADPKKEAGIEGARIAELEKTIDAYEGKLEPLTAFILPGGSALGASLHLARVVCRRAERRVVALSHSEQVHPSIIIYLNRLGDLLFVLARHANSKEGKKEEEWHKQPPT